MKNVAAGHGRSARGTARRSQTATTSQPLTTSAGMNVAKQAASEAASGDIYHSNDFAIAAFVARFVISSRIQSTLLALVLSLLIYVQYRSANFTHASSQTVVIVITFPSACQSINQSINFISETAI